MAQEGLKRRLTAILSADVEGYSRLMRDDEEATICRLTDFRKAMTTLIEQYRGRVVDAPGDNLLAEFGSVVDAVNCAVEIQRELAERNAELPEACMMQFRIGVNLGDVYEEGDRIYGDGVNIAARMERLAEPGGICISGTVHDSIVIKLGLEYEYMGEQAVKNIPDLIRSYRVLSYPGAAAHRVVKAKRAVQRKWRNTAFGMMAVLMVSVSVVGIWYYFMRPAPPSIEPASEKRMAFPLPDRPSIAVLPFTNMSGDSEQDYLGDGISENIISALSKASKMFVIARNSTLTYKGKPVKVQQVAEDLGVRYVLEGSVQKSGDRLRVAAQLIDTINGGHLWSERYNRKMSDLFDLQDEITKKIVVSLQVELTLGEEARIFAKSTNNYDAWSNVGKGFNLWQRFNKEDNAKSRELFKAAIALDPAYVTAWTLLAETHVKDAANGWSESRAASLKRANEIAQKVLAIDVNNAVVHTLLGNIYFGQRQLEKAITEYKSSISLDPNFAVGYALLGRAMNYSGQFEEAIELVKKAMRLNPQFRPAWMTFLATAYAYTERYEEAIAIYNQIRDRCLKGKCPSWWWQVGLAFVYVELGRKEEARALVAEARKTNPKLSLKRWKRRPYKDPAHLQRVLDKLRLAGVPDRPPLPLPDKPSIAILPFTNITGDPEQEYFSDGITEDIITDLSKMSGLFVISRSSTFAYKGKPVKIRQVADELNVRYVLEGSVRRGGDKIRINAQLIDATTGSHLWAERYDRDYKDIFVLQDEITQKIVMTLDVEVFEAEMERIRRIPTENLSAYESALRGVAYLRVYKKSTNAQAQQMFERAIELDPGYAGPYVGLGWTHLLEWLWGWSSDPQRMRRAFELAQMAINLDDSDAEAYMLIAMVYLWKDRQHQQAIAAAQKAIALDPNNAGGYSILAETLKFGGRPAEVIALMETGMRLNPRYPAGYLFQSGSSYYYLGRYQEALALLKRAATRRPNHMPTRQYMTAIYTELGREEEAKAELAEVLRISPNHSLEEMAKYPYKDPAYLERLRGHMRKAGLK